MAYNNPNVLKLDAPLRPMTRWSWTFTPTAPVAATTTPGLPAAPTGALIGLVLGTLAFVAIALVVGNASLGLGVAIALVAAGAIASSIGLLLPWSLSRIGIDPAFGAGPVATIVQDFLTILVYFVVMTRLVDVAP